MKMAADGWFPRRLADVSPRFGTPHCFLTIIWTVSMVAVVTMGEGYLDVFASLAAMAMLLGDLLGRPRGALLGGLFVAWLVLGLVYARWRGPAIGLHGPAVDRGSARSGPLPLS
ncbi:MAG: hypothetical protein ACYC6V_09700 [Bacillota bacterium]